MKQSVEDYNDESVATPLCFWEKEDYLSHKSFPLFDVSSTTIEKQDMGGKVRQAKGLVVFWELVAVQIMIQMEWITGNVMF